MLGISLGLFFRLTLQYKSSILLHTYPFSFLILFPFLPFITVSKPPMILQEPNAHDNLIVCWCSFNTKLWWEALRSGKAEGILVCVRPSFLCFYYISSTIFLILYYVDILCSLSFFSLNAVYNRGYFPFTDCKVLTPVSSLVDWAIVFIQGLFHLYTLMEFWVCRLVIWAPAAPKHTVKSLPSATVIVFAIST